MNNIFDMALPHAIAGAVKPGPKLLELFKERFHKERGDLALSSPELLNLFNNQMTGRDQWIQDQIAALSDSVVAFDSFECTEEVRLAAKSAKQAAGRGLASYGQMDGNDHVVEPRQVLKEHAYTSDAVHQTLVAPWVDDRNLEFAAEEVKLRMADGDKHADTPIENEHFDTLRADMSAFHERHKAIMKELILLHCAKFDRSFNSRIDKESIPAGYRAVWDGLQRELDNMPDRTANIAVALNNQLRSSDRTVFGEITNWLGVFFEDVRCRCRRTPLHSVLTPRLCVYRTALSMGGTGA